MNEHVVMHNPKTGVTKRVRPHIAPHLERKGWRREARASAPPPTPAPDPAQAPGAVLVVQEGTVAEVLAWVGNDRAKAGAARDAEQRRSGGPRKSLLAQLEQILGS